MSRQPINPRRTDRSPAHWPLRDVSETGTLYVMTLKQWLRREDVRAAGWTVYGLAEKLGISRSKLSRALNGHAVPRPPIVVAIYRITEGAVTPMDWYPEVMAMRRAKLKSSPASQALPT